MRSRIVGILLLLLLVVLPMGSQVLTLFTDALWFEEVGYSGVFTTILYLKAVLAVATTLAVALVLYVNLRLTAPGRAAGIALIEESEVAQLPSWSLIEPLYRRLRLPGCLVAGFLIGSQMASQWPTALRYWYGVPFGAAEPLFGRDVGFYVFSYPLLAGLAQLASLVTLLTLAAVAAVYVLSRAIRLTPRGLVITAWAKGHLLALGAAFLVLKAWGYGLDRYELLFSAGGAAFGASYSDVNASLPALNVLIGLAGLAAIACLLQMMRPGLSLAGGGVALWLIGSVLGLSVYPAALQRLRVAPNEIVAERPYIEQHHRRTPDRAYGLDRIEERPSRPRRR